MLHTFCKRRTARFVDSSTNRDQRISNLWVESARTGAKAPSSSTRRIRCDGHSRLAMHAGAYVGLNLVKLLLGITHDGSPMAVSVRSKGQVTIQKRGRDALGNTPGSKVVATSPETAIQLSFDAVSRRARACREVRHPTNSLLTGAASARAAMKATSTSSACWMCAARSLHAAATSPARQSRTNVMCSFSARMRPRLVRDN